MAMSPEQVREWAKKNSKFIKLADGDSFKGKLKDFKAIPDHFNPDKEVIRYTFEMEDGQLKYWDNGRASVVEAMAGFVGKLVEVWRRGEGKNDTSYEVLSAE